MTVTVDLSRFDAGLFDLDGVITDTASVHERAWGELFDEVLADDVACASSSGADRSPFTHDDYVRHVDGKPRADGIRAFFEARGISVPAGDPSDGPETFSLHGLGARKDRRFLAYLETDGVEVFASTVSAARTMLDAGLRVAVFSASRNAAAVLEAAGIAELFSVRVDGVVAAELGLPGKPDPATLLEAARRVEADPPRALVVEDAQAGVEAGAHGGFGLVIGIDRAGGAHLDEHGADVVVSDLGELRWETATSAHHDTGATDDG